MLATTFSLRPDKGLSGNVEPGLIKPKPPLVLKGINPNP